MRTDSCLMPKVNVIGERIERGDKGPLVSAAAGDTETLDGVTVC